MTVKNGIDPLEDRKRLHLNGRFLFLEIQEMAPCVEKSVPPKSFSDKTSPSTSGFEAPHVHRGGPQRRPGAKCSGVPGKKEKEKERTKEKEKDNNTSITSTGNILGSSPSPSERGQIQARAHARESKTPLTPEQQQLDQHLQTRVRDIQAKLSKAPKRTWNRNDFAGPCMIAMSQILALHQAVYPDTSYASPPVRARILGHLKAFRSKGIPLEQVVSSFQEYMKQRDFQALSKGHCWTTFLHRFDELSQATKPSSPQAQGLAILLYAEVSKCFPQLYPESQSPPASWARAFDALLHGGDYTVQSLTGLIQWYPKDSWWQFRITDAEGFCRVARKLEVAKFKAQALEKNTHKDESKTGLLRNVPKSPSWSGFANVVTAAANGFKG